MTFPTPAGITPGPALAIWNERFIDLIGHQEDSFGTFPGQFRVVDGVLFARNIENEQWFEILNVADDTGLLPITGGTVTGDFDMGGFKLTSVSSSPGVSDLANRTFLKSLHPFETGAYTGNGSARTINFGQMSSPAVTASQVIVARVDSVSAMTIKTIDMAGTASRQWGGASAWNATNRITALNQGSFDIGTDIRVNEDGTNYIYFASV